jgi:hypothetical protein
MGSFHFFYDDVRVRIIGNAHPKAVWTCLGITGATRWALADDQLYGFVFVVHRSFLVLGLYAGLEPARICLRKAKEMARAQYVVGYHEQQWKISLDGKRYGPYATQRDAIKAAIDAAHESGSRGIDAQVLVQGTDSKFRTEWTYGNDPYPPKG